jgi:hypothetical protein
MFKCRFSLRIWRGIKEWLDLQDFDITQWTSFDMVEDWWCSIIGVQGRQRKSLSSLILLAAWEIWSERNARVFRGVVFMPSFVLSTIKRNAALWGVAGAKILSAIMPRE